MDIHKNFTLHVTSCFSILPATPSLVATITIIYRKYYLLRIWLLGMRSIVGRGWDSPSQNECVAEKGLFGEAVEFGEV